MTSKTPLAIAAEITTETANLYEVLRNQHVDIPTDLNAQTSTELWTSHNAELERVRTRISTLTRKLNILLDGPHEFLHEYVSVNWEHGALYALLEHRVFEALPLDGAGVKVEELAAKAKLESAKLLRICRLISTVGILEEVREGVFAHTAISVALVQDEGFRSWVRFQLFETRVASAHLADCLKEGNGFFEGKSAFEHAWDMPMYTWHRINPDKGDRFATAMAEVAASLDPADEMIETHLNRLKRDGSKVEVIEAAVVDDSPSINTDTKKMVLLCNSLWLLDNNAVVAKLRTLLPKLLEDENTSLAILDFVSPSWGTFEPDVERIYRRRDVTMMTMHNVKQRTRHEWGELIVKAFPDAVVSSSISRSWLSRSNLSSSDLVHAKGVIAHLSWPVARFDGDEVIGFEEDRLDENFDAKFNFVCMMTLGNSLGPSIL